MLARSASRTSSTPNRGRVANGGGPLGAASSATARQAEELTGAFGAPQAAERPQPEEDDQRARTGEREPGVVVHAGDQPAAGLEERGRRVGGRDPVDPSLQQ